MHIISFYSILLLNSGWLWYGNTLFNDAGPDSNLLVSTGGVKTLTIYKKEKKEEIFTCEYFWCDHNYHLAIISSNNILKLVDRQVQDYAIFSLNFAHAREFMRCVNFCWCYSKCISTLAKLENCLTAVRIFQFSQWGYTQNDISKNQYYTTSSKCKILF